MKKEFQALKDLLFNSNTYVRTLYGEGMNNWDDVHGLLTELGAKIDEVEKRLVCADKTAVEIESAIDKYLSMVDRNESFVMDINDYEVISRGSRDIMIAVDLNDNEVIENNWYDLFQPKPKREVYLTLESSWGYITCDRDGMVIEVDGDLEFNGEKNYLYDIVKFDLDEYEKFLNELGWELEASHIDILSVGFWDNEGKYQEAEPTHRANYIVNPDKVVNEESHPIVGCGMCGHPQVVLEENIEVGENGHQVVRCDECQGATEIDAPTMLCADPKKHEIVNNIISQLNAIEVDGETMEYILKQVGMDQQMLKQLFAQTMNDDVDYLLDVRNGKA